MPNPLKLKVLLQAKPHPEDPELEGTQLCLAISRSDIQQMLDTLDEIGKADNQIVGVNMQVAAMDLTFEIYSDAAPKARLQYTKCLHDAKNRTISVSPL